MAPRSFTRSGRSLAPPAVVWPLVAEAARWREWSFLDRSGLETEGSPVPDGVGAVRRFTRYGVGSREQVVAWEPPTHLGYTILRGFPVRGYRADVVLTPVAPAGSAGGTAGDGAGAGGTSVTWSVRFEPRYPGTGAATEAVLRLIIRGFVTSLVRYADRQYAAGA